MRNFLKKAIKRIPRLDVNQIIKLVSVLSDEYELLEIVLDSMTTGVIVADKSDNLLFLNKAARRMLNLYTLNENVERKVWEVVKDPSINNFLCKYLAGEDDSKPVSIFVGANESESRLLEFRIVPLVKTSSIIGNVVTIEDVTDKKIKESKLRRAESLASLTTLAAGVAHEIKNPLGSISIYLQLMEKTISRNSESDICSSIKNNISVIKEEVERLNKIVVDFLFAVRPIDLDLNNENLNKIILETLELFTPELVKSGIIVDTDLCPKIPDLKLDKRYIKQVLINLIKNAELAMSKGGSLTITTECRDNQAVLKVIDTGTGIPDNILSRIFEPYFTTRDFGSGIGLTIVYKVVKEHKGDISIKTKENKGTTFIITFPLPQTEQRLIEYEGDDDEILNPDS